MKHHHYNRQYWYPVTNKDQWIQDKWNMKSNKKGYLKIHIPTDVKTKKILAMKVTDEHVPDNKALSGLVDGVIKSDSMVSTGKLIADDT